MNDSTPKLSAYDDVDYLSYEEKELQRELNAALLKKQKRKEDETLVSHALYRRFGRPATAREIRDFLDGDEKTQEEIWRFGIPVPGKAVMSEGSNAAE